MFEPIKISEKLKEALRSYISTAYKFRDSDLQSQFEKEVNAYISNGPFVEFDYAFKTGKTINELINEGVIVKEFKSLEKISVNKKKKIIPLDRPLYYHQEEAIRKITSGRNAVITTGTGSGKTNCFLIPILNELLREKVNGTLNNGIRALFIYPMNALANDQIKNIREILCDYPDITFGIYTGSTEEDTQTAILDHELSMMTEENESLKDLPNELISREQMRETQPNILFTNYSMLEHLMLRPNDKNLFANSNFKFVVLDEAHIYTGGTGMETAVLLRRLKARINRNNDNNKTRFILTSATLGKEDEEKGISKDTIDKDIIKFAYNLCGINISKDDIIRSVRIKNKLCGEECIKNFDLEKLNYIKNNINEDCSNINELFDHESIEYDEKISSSENLYNLLKNTRIHNKIVQLIDNESNILDFFELADRLSIDPNTLNSYLQLCLLSEKDGHSLINNKYHFFLRALDGCYISYDDEQPKLSLDKSEMTEKGNAVFEVGTCKSCGDIVYIGNDIIDEETHYHYLRQNNNRFDNTIEYYQEIDKENINDDNVYKLCLKCGSLTRKNQINNLPCNHDNYIFVKKLFSTEKGKFSCNTCRGELRNYFIGNKVATSILGYVLYTNLPQYKKVQTKKKVNVTDDPFASYLEDTKTDVINLKRQFLIFSDSRQQAAMYPQELRDRSNMLLRRILLYNCFKDYKKPITLEQAVVLLKKYIDNSNVFDKPEFESNDAEAAVALAEQIARNDKSNSFQSLGFLQYHYIFNTPDLCEGVKNYINNKYNANVSALEVCQYLDWLIMELIKKGTLIFEKGYFGDNERNYVFRAFKQRSFVNSSRPLDEKDDDSSNGNVTNSIIYTLPTRNKNGKNHYYKNKALDNTLRLLKLVYNNANVDEAISFIESYFKYVEKNEANNTSTSAQNDKGTVINAKNIQILFSKENNKNTKWYKCSNCGKIEVFGADLVCKKHRCKGQLKEIPDPFETLFTGYWAKLYSSEPTKQIAIEEHTAQLSELHSREYQRKFVKNELNALSCSTTFEMGVDVGNLETVFLRNVPPLPSNYAQRAGRAGRSKNSAAYVLSYCKLSSHDLTYFKNPKAMISGTVMPPIFKINNTKVNYRHIFAVALAWFLDKHKDVYNNNKANKFIRNGWICMKNELNQHPVDLLALLKESIPNEGELHKTLGIDSFKWVDTFFDDKKGLLTLAIEEYETNVKKIRTLN